MKYVFAFIYSNYSQIISVVGIYHCRVLHKIHFFYFSRSLKFPTWLVAVTGGTVFIYYFFVYVLGMGGA